MNSRLILASAFILSLALPQAACAAAPQATPPAAAAANADQEQLLAAERARLQAARAELAAQAAASPTPPSPSRVATAPAAATAQPTVPARPAPGKQPAANAPVSSEVAGAPAVPAAVDSPATTPDAVVAPPQTAPATGARPPVQPPATVAPAGPVGGPSAGSLLQTILALSFVLALLAGLAWFMKRFGAKAMGSSANLRIVGSLNLGGRERLMVVEVGNQWIVVGASPGRVNALATMPKQEGAEQSAALAGHMPAASSFGEWLKQTIDKRNGK